MRHVPDTHVLVHVTQSHVNLGDDGHERREGGSQAVWW